MAIRLLVTSRNEPSEASRMVTVSPTLTLACDSVSICRQTCPLSSVITNRVSRFRVTAATAAVIVSYVVHEAPAWQSGQMAGFAPHRDDEIPA